MVRSEVYPRRGGAILKQSTTSIQTSTLLNDFRLLLILFVTFRVMLLMIYQPIFASGIERGVTAGGDFMTYFQLGALSNQGLLPFRDWWSEFPPISSYLNVVIFQLFGRSGYTGFALLFGVIMMLFDVGNLVMVRRIGARLHGAGTGMALAWVYAVTLAPLVLIWWDFEPMVAFFLLWALATLIERRDVRSAIIAAVGGLTKFTPLLILGAVWRMRDMRLAARYTLVSVGAFALVYLLLFAQNSAMTLPSLTAQFNKASYQTVWALIDGNYSTGNFGAAQERLDPANASRLEGEPSVIPGVVRLGLATAGRAVRVLAHAALRRARLGRVRDDHAADLLPSGAGLESAVAGADRAAGAAVCPDARRRDGGGAAVAGDVRRIPVPVHPHGRHRRRDYGKPDAAVRGAGAVAHGDPDRHMRGAV
ncbi:MAG: hypothetical protein U0521_21745 [Anaerolineae bacterium]